MFCPNWSDDACGVVLEHEQVMALSARARQAGVSHGMRRGGVLILAPHARVHQRAPLQEAQALQAVALALLQYTPLVAAAEEATLLIDIGASLRLFGGIRKLCRAIRASLRGLGFTARLSCAPTARGAWLLARGGAGRTLTMAAMARRLDSLPASLAPPARPFLSWLDGIGCATLGQMRQLPRPGLQRRCGRELLDMLDAAHGHAVELFEWIVAPPSFRARLELFERVDDAGALLSGARSLLLQMTGWMCARQLAVESVNLLLEHERGRVARAPTVIDIVLAEPAWRGEHLLRLLKERLARMTLDAPVIGLCLEALQVHAMAPPSASLFPEPGATPQERRRLLELLAARLGEDNVLQAAPLADYRPETANAWLPVQRNISAAARQQQLPADLSGMPRPGWLLARPLALMTRNERPYYGSPLKMVSVPERIEAGWWSTAEARDYFIAVGQDHAHYWVYRERISGSGEDGAPRWYLHGLFS
ncbi:required for the error-prone processing of DNA lesions along with dnaE2 and imuA [Janthinobacterium agaricidamnosum NBRC 102515 = DSM 9628]|uniref:Required for the error-prone processing of DNA lesions along with dnaE2 and imuA n=1 Tax=Janthinobacterium agaricidamnosum NBRC 102515 = DSM 9628 TaxID=1349767 RepID=W0V280_9BURK|nr:required for the error-prone processing of DNA lesions along with dnaE2 and imuA [Janthinobacterium agaricidamnosum NBRC 102515 = DSM 9628]